MNLKPIKSIDIEPKITGIEILIIIAILGIVISFLHRAGVIDLDSIVTAGFDYFNVSDIIRKILSYIFNGILILLICLFTIERFMRERAEARKENKPWKKWFLRVLCLTVWLPFIFVFALVLIR